MASVLAIKLVSLVILFFVAILGGVIPIYWSFIRNSPRLLSHLNCFSAGVFISMALNHFLPDATRLFEKLNYSYPQMSCTMAMFGYALMLFIEKCVVDTIYTYTHSIVTHPRSTSQLREETVTFVSECRSALESVLESVDTKIESSESFNNVHASPRSKVAQPSLLLSTTCSIPLSDHDVYSETSSSSNFPHIDSDNIPSTVIHQHMPLSSNVSISSAVLFLALSIHAILEGIALGVQQSSNDVIMIAIGLIAHKWVEGVALATSFVKAHTSSVSPAPVSTPPQFGDANSENTLESVKSECPVIKEMDTSQSAKFIFAFALTSPLGVAIGIAISTAKSGYAEAIFTSIAAGTFVFIGCTEIIPEEFGSKQDMWTKFLVIVIGMIGIALLTQLDTSS